MNVEAMPCSEHGPLVVLLVILVPLAITGLWCSYEMFRLAIVMRKSRKESK